jgi:HEAT repeat protein
MSIVKNATPGSREVSMVTGALGYVGTPEAQSALLEIYQRSEATQDEKEKVLTELTLSPQAVTDETKSFLKEVFQNAKDEDLSKQAGFALGSSLSKVEDKQLVTDLQQKFQNAQSTQDKVFLLQVMGNDEKNDFRQQIANSTSSKDPAIRAAAADALRMATDNNGRNLLFEQTTDKNEGVRAVAYKALQYQPYDSKTFTALTSCATSETDVSTRAVCLDVLCSHLNDEQTVSFLKQRENAEQEPSLKMKIQNALIKYD